MIYDISITDIQVFFWCQYVLSYTRPNIGIFKSDNSLKKIILIKLTPSKNIHVSYENN